MTTTAPMTTTEKLTAIAAKCKSLLLLAEQRTPGKWRHATVGKPEYEGCHAERVDAVLASECRESDPVLHETFNGDDDHIGNAAYIAACAGAAEAGWRATIAAIEHIDWMSRANGEMLAIYIITAWEGQGLWT